MSKGAKPDRVAIGTIPMVLSKGIVNVPELVKYWKEKAKATSSDDNTSSSTSNDSSSKRQKISNS